MTGCVTFLPMLGQRAAGYRVIYLGGELCQRSQHETVSKYVGSRQAQRWLVDDEVAVQQQIDIEWSRRVPVRAALPSCQSMDHFDLIVNTRWPIVRLEANNEIPEIIPLESDGGVLISARDDEITVPAPEFIDAEPEIFFGVDIATKPKINNGHIRYPGSGRAPLSMITPTSRAPRIAPGLLTFTLTQATSNSSSTMAAMFSARVSTS